MKYFAQKVECVRQSTTILILSGEGVKVGRWKKWNLYHGDLLENLVPFEGKWTDSETESLVENLLPEVLWGNGRLLWMSLKQRMNLL